ncbi:MAG: bacteriohemerythrin [Kiloniellaceae bacterium]
MNKKSVGLYPTLPWSDRFRVGVEILDSDHLALVNLINEVAESLRSGRNQEATVAFDALRKLAEEHFSREEALLQGLRGPCNLAPHAVEHQARLKQLAMLCNQFADMKTVADADRIITDLVDWFVRQSIGHDAAIKAYFDEVR